MNLTIYIDMDETIVNLVDPWLEIIGTKLGDGSNFTREDINVYDVDKVIPPPRSSIYEPFHCPGFWEKLPPLPGAVEFVRELHNYGHDVYIASTPFRSDNCAWEKRLWIEEHLPFLDPEHNLILIRYKHLLRGHVIIDDKPKAIYRFSGTRILVDRPWNRNLRDIGMCEYWFYRAQHWSDIKELIRTKSLQMEKLNESDAR